MAVPAGYLSCDELSPQVDLASYFQLARSAPQRYGLPAHHLILVESGRILASPSGHRVVATAGDLICFRPAELNTYHSGPRTAFHQIHVLFAPPPRHRLTPWLDGIGPLPMKVRLGEVYESARRIFETICAHIRSGTLSDTLHIRAQILELLSLVAGACRGNSASRRPLDPWQRVRQKLESDLTRDVSVTDLARQMRVSPEHFIRRFKQRFGISPRAFHTQARLREAMRLLRFTDNSVKSVSYALGFSDPRAFTRLLRRHYKVRPTDLRSSGQTPPTAAAPAEGKLFPVNQVLAPPDEASALPDHARWQRKWGLDK